MRFQGVIDFALLIENQKDNPNKAYLENFQKTFNGELNPTPDIDIDLHFSKDELSYWSEVFFKVAEAIYRRELGNQENQEWQTSYIFVAYGFAKLFAESAKMHRS